jgi:hypothetical protein
VEFTAVILEKDTKHKLPDANKYRTLKDLARVFTNSGNPNRSLDSNRAFAAEFEEALAQVPGYSEGPTLKVFLHVCEGLILKWQRAHFDSLSRFGKQTSAGGQVQVDDANKPKRVRSEQGAYATVIITIARAAVYRGTDVISVSSAITLIGTAEASGSKAVHSPQ